MSQAQNSGASCVTPVTTNVPGISGLSSYTTITQSFVVPAVGGFVSTTFASTAQFVSGQAVAIGVSTNGFADFIGIFIVQVGPNNLVSLQLVSALAAVIGTTVPSGYQVSAAGIAGQAAYTTTGLTFNVASGLGATSVIFASTAWMAAGQVILISDPANSNQFAHYSVYQILSNSVALLTYLGYAGDTTIVGDTVNVNSLVVCSGPQAAIGSLPSAIVDSSGGAAAGVVAVGVGEALVTIPVSSLATGLSTSAVTMLNAYVPGFRFSILQLDFVTTIVGAGAGASQTFNLQITGANVTGGVVNPTLTSTNTIGKITAGTAVTAANTGGVTDSISLLMAASGTVFTSGAGYFVLRLKNLDTANAFASISAVVNSLIGAL